jgi:hypothetical protein
MVIDTLELDQPAAVALLIFLLCHYLPKLLFVSSWLSLSGAFTASMRWGFGMGEATYQCLKREKCCFISAIHRYHYQTGS